MKGAFTIITMERSFHGRTLGTLSATGQDKIQKGYDPLVPCFKHVPYGDLEAVKAVWDDNVCAVLVEPVLGEGGVVVPPDGYLPGLRELCDSHGALLMFDEVQTGLGRTGKLFAHEHFGVKPHVMTLAKALANGLPAGAVLADVEAAEMFGPGSHATTLGPDPWSWPPPGWCSKTWSTAGWWSTPRPPAITSRRNWKAWPPSTPRW